MLTWNMMSTYYVDIMFFEKTHLHPQVMPRNLRQAMGIFQSVSQLICWNWDEKNHKMLLTVRISDHIYNVHVYNYSENILPVCLIFAFTLQF